MIATAFIGHGVKATTSYGRTDTCAAIAALIGALCSASASVVILMSVRFFVF